MGPAIQAVEELKRVYGLDYDLSGSRELEEAPDPDAA
jgi:hypothetical protein